MRDDVLNKKRFGMYNRATRFTSDTSTANVDPLKHFILLSLCCWRLQNRSGGKNGGRTGAL